MSTQSDNKKRYYISLNFTCETAGAAPTDEQLNKALKDWIAESEKENEPLELEIWDEEETARTS